MVTMIVLIVGLLIMMLMSFFYAYMKQKRHFESLKNALLMRNQLHR